VSRHSRERPLGSAAFGDALLGLGMATASAMSYVFIVILSRALGPADFGGFSSFNSIGLVLAIPAAAFQVIYASRVARRGRPAFDLRLPLLVGVVGCLLTVALSPVLAHVTRVDSILAPIVVALGLPALILNGALMGGLLGMRRIGALSLAYVATGVGRVLAATTAAVMGLGLIGALALVSLATCVMAGILWWFCRGQAHLPWSAPRGAPGAVVRMLYRSNSAIAVLMALTTIDVVLARYVLPPVESGEYALISTLGRSPIWVTQFLALALIPTLATSGSPRSILRAGGLVLGVCALGTTVAAAAPGFWVGLLGGSAYHAAQDLLLPYLALGTLLALAQVLVMAEMARGRHLLARVAWLAVLLEVVLCLTYARDSAFRVLGAAIVASSLVVVVGVAELVLGIRREPGPVEGSVAASPLTFSHPGQGDT
jgi:O-antigen/teichoic acid export membrane protein